MTAVIEQALATARTYESVDEIRLAQAINGLKNKYDNLLGVEAHAKGEMERQLATLAREMKRLEHWQTMGLPMIDEVVLTWRNGDLKGIPLPKLIMTSLSSPQTCFMARGEYYGQNYEVRDVNTTPQLPRIAIDAYSDVVKGVERLSKMKRGRVTLATNYHGIIPDKAKQEMASSPFREDELFLLREVEKKDWQLGIKTDPRPPRPRLIDPLVVGVRDATLWLVTSFDPTPLEEYVRDEFALLAGGGLLQLNAGSDS